MTTDLPIVPNSPYSVVFIIIMSIIIRGVNFERTRRQSLIIQVNMRSNQESDTRCYFTKK